MENTKPFKSHYVRNESGFTVDFTKVNGIFKLVLVLMQTLGIFRLFTSSLTTTTTKKGYISLQFKSEKKQN